MTEKPPLTTDQHITRAKRYLADEAPAEQAIAHALVAIAELMQTNIAETYIAGTKLGAEVTAEALGTIFSLVNPGTVQPCRVKSAGGRTCIHNDGHLEIHEDEHGWGWISSGEHASPIGRDLDDQHVVDAEIVDDEHQDENQCSNGGGPHMWTDTGGGVEVCECCGDERPA